KKSILRSQPVFCDPVLIKKKRLEQLARALIQLCFSGLLAVLCRSHVLCRKTHPFPGAILQDATPAAAEAKILSAFAARDGFPAIAAWVAVLHRAPAEGPEVWPAPVRNLAGRCPENFGNSDVAPECFGYCCCRAAAAVHRGHLAAAARVGYSSVAAAAATEVARQPPTDAAHCAFRDCRSACLDGCSPVPDDSCPAHLAAQQEHCSAYSGGSPECSGLHARYRSPRTHRDCSGVLHLPIHCPLAPLASERSDGSRSDCHRDSSQYCHDQRSDCHRDSSQYCHDQRSDCHRDSSQDCRHDWYPDCRHGSRHSWVELLRDWWCSGHCSGPADVLPE